MKVLKAPATDWSYKTTCGNCTAELEIEKHDLKVDSGSDPRDHGSWENWSALCPICRHGLSVPKDKIPQAVKAEVKDGRVSKRTTSINPPGGDFRDGPFEDFWNK